MTKVDARGVKTDYVYDALNRVTNRNYSLTSSTPPNYQATPNVTYTYGTTAPKVGKLTKVESSVSTTEYTSFDILGRVTAHKQTTDSNDYTTAYAYDLSGALIEETYPSTRVVKNTLDSNGDLEMVESKKNSSSGYWSYANNFTYNAAGAVTSMQLVNGTWESTSFNSRLQLEQIVLRTASTGEQAYDKLKLNYTYGTTNNNGNVVSQTITVPDVGIEDGFTAVQTYTYDSLNRLNDATENITPNGGSAAQSWMQTFLYDRYGNRTFDVDQNRTTTIPVGCPTAVCNPSANPSDNKLKTSDGYLFDNSGNTAEDAADRRFTYDGENKQVKVETIDENGNVTGTVGEYWYDGDGKRIKKYVPPAGEDPGELTIFVYDAMGKLVAEYSTIVASANDAKVAYLTSDHLGSPRINTDRDGNVTARHDYHPFGEEIATSQRTAGLGYADDTVRKQFTGYERDNESELDFAEARYYKPNHGRFTSVDPLMASARKANPQTFNRYAYVANNPLNYVDPSGMMGCPPSNPNCGPTTGGIRIQNPCDMGTAGCNPVNLGTVEVRDTAPPPVIETTTANVSTEITTRPMEPAAGFVGPPPVIAPGAPAPVTTAPPGAAPSIGRAIGLLGRTLIASMLAPAAIILAAPTTVQAPAPLPTGTTTTTTQDRDRDPTQNIFRVFGGAAPQYGWSWTPVDPRTVPNYRDAAGLPASNTGEFLVQGTVRTSQIQGIRPALPLHGNRGGLVEYIINPRNVIITMRTQVTPPF